MKIIVCIDKKNGMLFNGRRLSQDSVLRERILRMSSNAKLRMNEYSVKQFENRIDILVSDDFLSKAEDGDYCFVENSEIPKDKIEEIIVYKWNRAYPADTFFEFDFKSNGFKKSDKIDFVGSSHEKITEEIYIRK